MNDRIAQFKKGLYLNFWGDLIIYHGDSHFEQWDSNHQEFVVWYMAPMNSWEFVSEI